MTIVLRDEFMNENGVDTMTDCLMVSQICYWAEKMRFQEFYKTDAELAKEIKISLGTFKRHKSKLNLIPFLTVKQRGLPRRTYYFIDPYKVSHPVGSKWVDLLTQNDSTGRLKINPLYIEQKDTTEDYNRERGSEASPILSPSPSFLDRFYGEWEQITGTSFERQLRITKWFNVSSDGDNELAIANISRYVKAAKELGKSLKHPYFFLEDREFSKAYVVDTPLALKETPATQSIILNNNHSPEIQKQLIEELGEPKYKSWFEQCQIVQSGCDIEVTAPNNFVKENVEELLGKSRFKRSYDSIKVMIAEFICVLLEYLEPIEQYCCV